MLYAEGLESVATRRVRAEAERAERHDRELDGVTFRPATTAMAARLEMEPAWRRLSSGMRKQTLERLEEMRTAKQEAEVSVEYIVCALLRVCVCVCVLCRLCMSASDDTTVGCECSHMWGYTRHSAKLEVALSASVW